ncbi:DUF6011 domain-containing protein [Mycobacterium sp. NPDC003323]
MSPRKRPAPSDRPLRNHSTCATDSIVHRPEDGYAAPTADERREQQLLDELRALGYSISVRCRECGHPLSTPQSVAAHIGPKCAAKAVTGE